MLTVGFAAGTRRRITERYILRVLVRLIQADDYREAPVVVRLHRHADAPQASPAFGSHGSSHDLSGAHLWITSIPRRVLACGAKDAPYAPPSAPTGEPRSDRPLAPAC